ncbi:MAG: FAD:protein FMN transferase [Bacillota bacterium]
MADSIKRLIKKLKTLPRKERWDMKDRAAAEAAHSGMGTEMIHKAFGRYPANALRAVKNETERLECMLSRFQPGSDISRINRSAGIKREKISPETCDILSRALKCSAASQGFFDVTVGPLVDLWDYKHASEPPENSRIKAVLPLVDYTGLELDAAAKTAGLKNPGQHIDLGGIGKGFAGDRFMEIFKKYGVASAFSNIGGNVSTLGSKPDGSPWRVGIRHPRLNGLIGMVEVTGKAVVTSGDYERYFFNKEGRRFHHILNPATGYPAESGLVSVTVVADSAMIADALSTAMFVAGLERGLALREKYPCTEAVLVNTKMQVYVTRGLRNCFRTAGGIHTIYM